MLENELDEELNAEIYEAFEELKMTWDLCEFSAKEIFEAGFRAARESKGE